MISLNPSNNSLMWFHYLPHFAEEETRLRFSNSSDVHLECSRAGTFLFPLLWNPRSHLLSIFYWVSRIVLISFWYILDTPGQLYVLQTSPNLLFSFHLKSVVLWWVGVLNFYEGKFLMVNTFWTSLRMIELIKDHFIDYFKDVMSSFFNVWHGRGLQEPAKL